VSSAERGRENVARGMRELQFGFHCVEHFAARGRRRAEDLDPQLARDIREIVGPKSYTDPELKSSRRYSTLSANEVREALAARGYGEDGGRKLPSERSMREILNRMFGEEPAHVARQRLLRTRARITCAISQQRRLYSVG